MRCELVEMLNISVFNLEYEMIIWKNKNEMMNYLSFETDFEI